MLQVVNHTPFSASLSVLSDTDGVESVFAIVKASFRITFEDPEVLAPQVPLLATDVFWGDPMATSLRAAGEFGLMKPATDVLLLGHAVAPEPGTRVADVSLSVGPVNRTVRVFGDRHWEKSGGQWRPSAPAAWDTMPLRWERAWGGIAPADLDAQGLPEHEPRNPVGVGIASRRDGPLEGQSLPNLEDPQALIAKPGDRPVPACFGPIPPTWLPRRDFAGTYDDGWTKKRAPYLPLDFDSRFFQVAPPALIAPGFLQGGEPVRLAGFTAGAPLDFSLPDCGLELEFDFDGAPVPKTPQLEMVLFEPDLGRFQMLWRAALPVDKKLLRLIEVVIRSTVFAADGSKIVPLSGLNAMPPSYAGEEADEEQDDVPDEDDDDDPSDDDDDLEDEAANDASSTAR